MPCRAGDVGASGLGRAGGGSQGQAGLQTSQVPPPRPTLRDHDDDVSLVEACRKLNEVIGLKGMSRYGRWDPCAPDTHSSATGASRWWLLRDLRCDAHPTAPRYFKQIVKSARTNGTAGPTEDLTDDFLGCLNIPIRVSGCRGVTHGTPAHGCPAFLGYHCWLCPVMPPTVSHLSGAGGAPCWEKWGRDSLQGSRHP